MVEMLSLEVPKALDSRAMTPWGPIRTCLPATMLAAVLSLPALAQDDERDLANVKERELETVREKISDLKKSMDKRAADRDRVRPLPDLRNRNHPRDGPGRPDPGNFRPTRLRRRNRVHAPQ